MILFYSHNKRNGYLSNWYPSKFTLNSIEFNSVEQYMMYMKALCFGDIYNCERILKSNDKAAIKKYGRAVKPYDDVIWNGLRQLIVYEGVKAKFEQNAELKELLLSTGGELLVEASPYDKIWGCGLAATDLAILDRNNWPGKNLLGFTLMRVRTVIREENKLHAESVLTDDTAESASTLTTVKFDLEVDDSYYVPVCDKARDWSRKSGVELIPELVDVDLNSAYSVIANVSLSDGLFVLSRVEDTILVCADDHEIAFTLDPWGRLLDAATRDYVYTNRREAEIELSRTYGVYAKWQIVLLTKMEDAHWL